MKKILVATDLSSRSDYAIERAAVLARTFNSKWAIVHLVDGDSPKRFIERNIEDARELLQERVASLAVISGSEPEIIIEAGDIENTINNVAHKIDADLLVLGIPRKGFLREMFVGTSAERIIRSTRLPVLQAIKGSESEYKTIMLAADMSHNCANAIKKCQELGLFENRNVHVVYVFEDYAKGELLSAAEMGIATAIQSESKEKAREELREFLLTNNLELPDEQIHVEEGFSVVTLCEVAKKINPDLMVLGTHGRTGLKKLMLGSVAETMLSEVDRDMLCIPTPDK